MIIKGLDQLGRHVPDLATPLGMLRFVLVPVALFLLTTFFLTRVGPVSLAGTLSLEILVGSAGFLLLYVFVRYKDDFKARYGFLAYSKVIGWIGLPGVSIIAAAVGRIRSIPGPELPSQWQAGILPALGWALIALGALLFLRTLRTFGIDYLTMLYVYFPEDGRLVEHRIYSILRHPAYAAAQQIAFGLALLNGNGSGLACALIFALGLWGWVRLVEEKELTERFGSAYVEYRQRVPAFWPRLRNLGGFFAFLILGR